MTYLGEVTDCQPTMVKLISDNINKAKKSLGGICYAARQSIKLSSLVSIVRATVQSRLEYGLHICYPVSDAQFGRMDKILNHDLRTARPP